MSQISTNQSAVRSRTSAVGRLLQGDRQAAAGFNTAARGALAPTDGTARTEAEEFASVTAQTMLAAIETLDRLQQFMDNTATRVLVIDSRTRFPDEIHPVTVTPAPGGSN